MKKISLILVLALLCVSVVMATEDVSVDLDVDSGVVTIDISDTKTEATFEGMGEFEGLFTAKGTGYVDTNVNVESTLGASFKFEARQDLINQQVEMKSFAIGDTALMNNRFDTSNYIVQFERVDTGLDLLRASGSNYGVGFSTELSDTDVTAFSYVEMFGDGEGLFDTNQWHSSVVSSYGWGNANSINMPQTAGYYTPTNTVSATGDGTYNQYGFGENSLSMNGFTLGSGNAMFSANFVGSFDGDFETRAN